MGILKPLFISIFIIISYSGCSKIGEIVGIDIPKDNEIDKAINENIYYPFQEQMCDWGFRVSGCEEKNTRVVTPPETSENPEDPEDPNDTKVCDEGYKLIGETCLPVTTENKYKDVTSKWYDILTEAQQLFIRKDRNNIYPDNKDLTVLTPLDPIPEDGLKMLQNTKVVLPYYIFNEKIETQLALVSSSEKQTIYPNIIDSSNGAFKVIDSNSILFLELEAKGKIGDSASISLKVQEEDATKFDKEDINVSIVDSNETYNPVSLFFTYNTIIIEEESSRNIYFGISYTIDSNVTVVVRSDLEKILSDDNTTLDLQNMSENNSVVSAFVSNDNGVPFYFRLDAKGKAGDNMDLFLVAKDSRGKYDFKKFKVLIVGKGLIDEPPILVPPTPIPTLVGDDFHILNATQQALVNDDSNNYKPASTDKPVITIFNPEPTIKIPKGKSVTISFYVKDSGKESIQTSVYDDITKIKANMENFGKFTVTYSNKLFFLTLEAVGEIGDIVDIIIYSQNANDETQSDQESFKVEIIAPEEEGTYIEPLIYLGFNKLFIEEGGYRTGLQFSIAKSKDFTPKIEIEDETVVEFLEWKSIDPPKFSIKALGKSGDTTTLTIIASDGIKSDERVIDITIIPLGELANYLDKETILTTNPTTPSSKSCDDGFHLEGGTCVVDAVDVTCPTGFEEDENGDCKSIEGNITVPQTCMEDYHIDEETNQCVPDKTSITCDEGFELKDDNKCYKIGEENPEPVDPECNDGYHIENNECIADTTPITCDDGFNLQNGECFSEDNTTISDPICQDGYHIENKVCVANVDDLVCEEGFHLKDSDCIPDSGGDPETPTCKTGFHLEDNQCVTDQVDPTCTDGYYLKDGKCIANSGGEEPIPPICQDGYNLQNGICIIDLICETGTHIENDECVADIPTCDIGFHIEGNICVEDGNESKPIVCKDGQIEENGTCVDEPSRNLDNIAYEDWTDNEKAKVSVEICSLKIDETGYSVLEATAVTAEGFKNELGTIILHTNKTPVANGIAQNVALKMIYKEIYTASPTSKMLDATFRVPQFRVDYTIEYSLDTFYIIDESNGKCYTNTFPSENSIPFGILELARPDGM